MLRFVQLSDPHLLATDTEKKGVRPNRRFAQALAQIQRMDPAPAFCVVTGDLVAEETPAHYAALQALCADLAVPVHFALGNHDDRALFWETVGRPAPSPSVFADGERHAYHFTLKDEERTRFWVLDSHVDGEVGGALGDAQRAWLASGLSATDVDQHVVFVHHPPVNIGWALMDAAKLADGDALLEVLSASRAPVVRVFFGHVHQPITATAQGITMTSAPSTGYQFTDEEVTPKVNPSAAGYNVVRVGDGAVVALQVPIVVEEALPGGVGA